MTNTRNPMVMGKVILQGTLKLLSPLLIGTGDMRGERRSEVDTLVLTDKEERPFIPGTSLAGVLRSWFEDVDKEAAMLLFGGINQQGMADMQSAIDIADIMLEKTSLVLRDGVSIDGATGTGIEGRKYDYEAVERGGEGQLYMVITLRTYHYEARKDWQELVQKLVNLLRTGIRLGALTAKGFGHVASENISAAWYDFSKVADVKAWLCNDTPALTLKGRRQHSAANTTLVVDADFSLRHSLIVRNTHIDRKKNGNKIAAEQMKSKGDFLIPGTSLKGVLRHQAEYILHAIGKPTSLLDDLMGYSTKERSQKSRFTVDEVYFKEGVKAAPQTRNRLDRFTGGTLSSALFTTEPVWQKGNEGTLHIHYEIRQCEAWEAGLALFLLKDLWTGRVAIGGEKAVGRGTLQGVKAEVAFMDEKYVLGDAGQVIQGDAAKLEQYAKALLGVAKEADA